MQSCQQAHPRRTRSETLVFPEMIPTRIQISAIVPNECKQCTGSFTRTHTNPQMLSSQRTITNSRNEHTNSIGLVSVQCTYRILRLMVFEPSSQCGWHSDFDLVSLTSDADRIRSLKQSESSKSSNSWLRECVSITQKLAGHFQTKCIHRSKSMQN